MSDQTTSPEHRRYGLCQALRLSLSYPGRAVQVPVAGLQAYVMLADAFDDLKTSCSTPDPQLHVLLAESEAHFLPPHQAMHQFYPELNHNGAPTARTRASRHPHCAGSLCNSGDWLYLPYGIMAAP